MPKKPRLGDNAPTIRAVRRCGLVLCFALISEFGACQPQPTVDCSVDLNFPSEIVIYAKDIDIKDLNRADAWTLYSHSSTKKTYARLLITDTNEIVDPAVSVHLTLASALPSDVDNISGLVATSKAVIQVPSCTTKPSSRVGAAKTAEYKAATRRDGFRHLL